jgi:hypothetical protein
MKSNLNTLEIKKGLIKSSLILVFVLFTYIQSLATAGGCPGSVNWSGFTAGTCPFWNGGTQLTFQPSPGDNLVIPTGCTVCVMGQPVTINNAVTIIVNGQLNFGNSNKLSLAAGSKIVVGFGGSFNAGNGGGNNNYIDIGATAVWTANIGDISGTFILNGSCVLTGSSPNTYSPTGCGTVLLPIELLEYTGTCITNGIQLNWVTATEINNDYFLIEKSDNGYDWKQIAKVKGLVNSYTITKYVHIDYTNQNNLNYYRISQVDVNGLKTVFKPFDVYCSEKDIKDQMILYPNPSSTELNIVLSVSKLATNTNITLVNSAGQLIFETKVNLIKGVNSFAFPFDIPSGAYTVLFSSNDVVIPAQKLMIIKS